MDTGLWGVSGSTFVHSCWRVLSLWHRIYFGMENVLFAHYWDNAHRKGTLEMTSLRTYIGVQQYPACIEAQVSIFDLLLNILECNNILLSAPRSFNQPPFT